MAVANQAACHFAAWHMKPEGFSLLLAFSWPREWGLGLLKGASSDLMCIQGTAAGKYKMHNKSVIENLGRH